MKYTRTLSCWGLYRIVSAFTIKNVASLHRKSSISKTKKVLLKPFYCSINNFKIVSSIIFSSIANQF